MNCESCGRENIDGARFCASCGAQLARPVGDSWIGRLVGGRFKVTEVLGEGGMGVVYAAEQHMGSTVRKAAIKTLHPHLSQDPSVLARFHRECGTVAQLEHPNTIKVFDFGEEKGTLYIAMEFVEGRSLDKVIAAEGPLSPARVVNILEQVAGALDEAHGLGIVHRDLKPENVVLGERLGKKDFVKVLDFGIAARTESSDAQKEKKLTQQGMVLGTPPYMSPEQFTGVELDRRSDVYSLSVMTYEMLTGRLPFEADTPWQWATEHMTAQPFPIEQVPTGAGIPRGMRAAVMRALAKNREERPASAGEFVAELKAGAAGSAEMLSAPTEAMQAVPAFAASRAPSIPASVAASTAGPGSDVAARVTATAEGMAHTQGFSVPRKSNAGLLLGLSIGVVVALGGAAFALGAFGGDSTETADGSASGPSTTTAGPATPLASSAPVVDASPPSPSTSPPVSPTAAPTSEPSPSSPKPPDPKAPVGATTGTTTGATSGTTTGSSKPATKPPDCSKCVSLVSAGSWSQAATLFASCDAASQTTCRAHARREAVTQATKASKAGQCGQAKTIASASTRMGAFSSRVGDAANSCK